MHSHGGLDDATTFTMMKAAGCKNLRALPLRINLNEIANEFGGDRLAGGLGRLLRGEVNHRRMRRKYQRPSPASGSLFRLIHPSRIRNG